MDDAISRADVEQTVEDNILCYTHSDRAIDQDPDTECHMAIRTALRMLRKDLRKLPPAQPEPQWIPFKTRPLTEEEKEDYPGWDSILDCKLPDDGQMILVSINLHGHERVQYDEFFADGGCYLDSGYELGAEAIAWMPLPEPYAERRENEMDS